MKKNEILLKKVFGDKRIVALAGEKSSGKTNNLVYLIKDFREKNKNAPIYVYGMPNNVMKYLSKLDIQEISSLKHLIGKKNCIVVIDEFQKLKLNDRRYKAELDNFIDFIYHSNVYVIFSSPNIREFNTIIGSKIERWLLKTVRIDHCIRGSQLKKVIDDYKGRFKALESIQMNKNMLLVINDEKELVVKCEYVKEADSKVNNVSLFC